MKAKGTANGQNGYRAAAPRTWRRLATTIERNGLRVALLMVAIAHLLSASPQTWGDIDYDGQPWVKNVSRPCEFSHGLENRHLTLWASHGRYYDLVKQEWRWQRPKLFCTTEDLYTQTIVLPYLIPMLERAGAVVFTPRERDWQKREVIIDRDNPRNAGHYTETSSKHAWQDAGRRGFALHEGTYVDGENPFEAGGVRMAEATESSRNLSEISYQPQIEKAGNYAVYVSYATLPNSVDDAHYTVVHQGQATEFRVNQRMGGSTWVYLGTFRFDKGCSERNRVVLTNQSEHQGAVTADAVRFGGGMGNIEREGVTSGLPRSLECSRYYAQWAGMPYAVYSSKNGEDDYKDDINARSLMSNYLTGGSCYQPDSAGLGVPLELSLAVHSDAGFNPDGESVYGTLSICTTVNDSLTEFQTGVSREASRVLAEDLLYNTVNDLQYKYGNWAMRDLYDRNYSETRNPDVPSAILETLSHQSFPDMKYGQDPNFRFTLARSVYKTLVRYISRMHQRECVIAPLAPDHFRIEMENKRGEVRLSWNAVLDDYEPTAKPTGYIVYTAKGEDGFDNGEHVGHTSHTVKLEPGVLYSFKVSAVNKGGESFTTETLSALYTPQASQTVLVVNGFHRVSSPAVVEDEFQQGFDLDEDPGITLGPTAGWLGTQLVFDRTGMGIEGPSGLGYSDEDYAGTILAGNDLNYTVAHARAIASARRYNVVSCSSEAVESGQVDMQPYALVDLILGMERNDGHSLVPYKTFSPTLQRLLSSYAQGGGALLVSGAYVGSDMLAPAERDFLANTLKCQYAGNSYTGNDTISGLGTTFRYYHHPNEDHYAATHPNILQPVGSVAFPAMAYADQRSAAVAYAGSDYRAFTMGFPFECIRSEEQQAIIMRGLMNYLIK